MVEMAKLMALDLGVITQIYFLSHVGSLCLLFVLGFQYKHSWHKERKKFQ